MRTQSGQETVNTDTTMGRAAGSFPRPFHMEDVSKQFVVFTSEFYTSHVPQSDYGPSLNGNSCTK